jgi:F420-dependent oxidoreductase-like protein
MKIGLQMGYWGAGPPPNAVELVTEADRLGYDSVWTAESYGSDALTPLAWWGSQTERVRLGTSLCQLSARTPTAMAMAAQTLDHLSGGRFVLGLGVSGPQVVEGWYGQPFPAPLARTREYVDVVRQVLARQKPVTNDGPHYPLPYPGGTGLGKPLKSIVHPLRADIPIILGAEGPKNVALAAEIADGWFPIFFSPRAMSSFEASLDEGFARPGARRSAADFEVLAFAPTVLSDDTEAAADGFRPYLALYIGGMGAKEMNFHFDVFARMGYEEAAKRFRAHVRACASRRHRTDGNGLSEVGQLGVPGHVHQHVLRFDVPVEESLLMRERETGKGARMRREVGTTKDRRRDP